MGACNLSTDIRNLAIRIKDLLRRSNHSEWMDVDYFLCQYDYKNIYDKEELINSMLGVCHIRSYGDLSVSGIEYSAWVNLLDFFSGLLREHQSKLYAEISKITFPKLAFNGKEFDIKRDAFNWIIINNVVVLLLKENNKEFNDNLIAVDIEGKVLWSSVDIINVSNRLGACFVGLHTDFNDESIVIAQAYVGINYIIEADTGKIIKKMITK